MIFNTGTLEWGGAMPSLPFQLGWGLRGPGKKDPFKSIAPLTNFSFRRPCFRNSPHPGLKFILAPPFICSLCDWWALMSTFTRFYCTFPPVLAQPFNISCFWCDWRGVIILSFHFSELGNICRFHQRRKGKIISVYRPQSLIFRSSGFIYAGDLPEGIFDGSVSLLKL